MNISICCVFYGRGRCGHPRAPQPFFGRPECILVSMDPRCQRCSLQHAYEPPPPPLPPPAKNWSVR